MESETPAFFWKINSESGLLKAPYGLGLDQVGNAYISDQKNNAIRKFPMR